MDYPGPLITFPAASERPVTLLPCGKKLSPFPSSMGHCAAPLQLLGIPGRCCQWVTSDTHCQGANSLSLGKGDVWEQTRARLCLSLQDELIPPRATLRNPGCATTAPVLLLPPKVRGQELRGCCDIRPPLLWADLFWFLQCSGTFLTPPLLLSVLPHLMRFGPRTSWGKGMFLVKPLAAGRELKSELLFTSSCSALQTSEATVAWRFLKSKQTPKLDVSWVIIYGFFPISSEQTSCLLISNLLLSQCCRVCIHLL